MIVCKVPLKVKKLYEDSVLPKMATDGSAGYDLCAHLKENVLIYPGETVMIKSGIAAEIPEGFFGGVYSRSGLSTNNGLRLSNGVGIIDSDYRGEIGIPLHNDSGTWQIIAPGDRIAQLIIQPYVGLDVECVEQLTDTDRGSGGFGHTGR